jgi:hypothetical protein
MLRIHEDTHLGKKKKKLPGFLIYGTFPIFTESKCAEGIFVNSYIYVPRLYSNQNNSSL